MYIQIYMYLKTYYISKYNNTYINTQIGSKEYVPLIFHLLRNDNCEMIILVQYTYFPMNVIS